MKFHNSASFTKEIEKRTLDGQCGYIEAIVEYCQERGIEVESIPKLITPDMREKIRKEGVGLNFLDRGKKLATNTKRRSKRK